MLSNSHPKHIEPLISLVGIKDLISHVYAIDRHYSHKIQNPTEEKTKILRKIIKKRNLKRGQLIAIGDKAADVNSGIAVGAITYQYLRKGFPTDKTRADYKIYDLREILREI